MNKEELLQNDIIRVMRIYFNDKPCREWTTGFVRQCAKDVINLCNQDSELDYIDYQKENKKLQSENDYKTYLLKTVLEDLKNLRIGLIEENDPEINHTISLIKKELRREE